MTIAAIITLLLDIYDRIGAKIIDAAAAAKQTGELTVAQHNEIVAYMDGEAARPEWLPDAPPGPPTVGGA